MEERVMPVQMLIFVRKDGLANVNLIVKDDNAKYANPRQNLQVIKLNQKVPQTLV